jgi:cell filamentation protein
MAEDDKYTYPGSGGVLVNSLGIRDAARLDAAMNDYASFAMAEMYAQAIPERPGSDYLIEIHERMFNRIAPGIAGRIRDVDAQATGTGIPYCRPEYIEENLGALFRKLDREDYLSGLGEREFAERLADRWGELSAIHPFRDGNTRSQSTYVTMIAERAGHPIDWDRIDVDTLRTLRLNAVAGQDKPLAEYLAGRLLTTGQSTGGLPKLTPELQRIVELNKRSYPTSATEIGRRAKDGQRGTEGTAEGRGYRPPQQGRSADNGWER